MRTEYEALCIPDRQSSPPELRDLTNEIQEVIENKAWDEIDQDDELWLGWLSDHRDGPRLLSSLVKSTGEYQRMEAVQAIKGLREEYQQWRVEVAQAGAEWGRIEDDLRS
jgi:hypothetical protein